MNRTIRNARLRLLTLHYRAGVGHIGGNLSCLDCLVSLQHWVMHPEDLFVLSKGHSAGALYVALWSAGKMSEEVLSTFTKDGGYLAAHPIGGWHDQIRFSTGSLGHGIALASGVALERQFSSKPGRVFCLVSDGELQEGSCWEGVAFAASKQLPVHILVDVNGLQGFGSTRSIGGYGAEELAARFRAFGVTDLVTIDGHDPAEIIAHANRSIGEGPCVTILNTVKGHGVSFMQDQLAWHYLPMDSAQYQQAVAEIASC